MAEVQEMKKRFLEAKVKAVKLKEDVSKVKPPKKRVAIEKVESDDRKKKKLAFLLPESEVLNRGGAERREQTRWWLTRLGSLTWGRGRLQ